MADPVATVTAAFEHWCSREGVTGLHVVEVLPKSGYLSITFAASLRSAEAEVVARKFVADLMTMHPELGGTHLVFWGRLPAYRTNEEARAAADAACAFAREYLDNITRTRGTHKLYVGDPDVSTDGVTIWILRDDCNARDLDLDEESVARKIARAYGGSVRFEGDYCK